MFQWRLFLVLLRPSLLSTILTLLAGIILFSIIGWAYISQSPGAYNYFFGTQGLTAGIEETSAYEPQIAGEGSWVYNVLIIVGALGVGVVVYALLQTMAKIMFTVSETIEEVQEGDQVAKRQVEKEIIMRVMVRVFVAILWLAYIYLSFRLALPYCVSLFKNGAALFPTLESIMYFLGAFALFFIIVHLHVICARLLLLRPRVFGGDYVIMSAMN